MAWSGITKYLRQVCLGQGRPMELPQFAIFVPTEVLRNEPVKLTTQTLNQMGNKDYEVNLMISEHFLNSANGAVRIPENSSTISSYDSKPHLNHLAQINFAQVAKVCDTDL